jgi:hypothetical protein
MENHSKSPNKYSGGFNIEYKYQNFFISAFRGLGNLEGGNPANKHPSRKKATQKGNNAQSFAQLCLLIP